MLIGYQSLNGRMLFQFHVLGVAPADQPHLVQTGDRLNFGPLGPYTVGAFHQANANVIDPTTGKVVLIDTSTVEIIDDAGHKTQLQFRRAVEIKPGSGTLTRAGSAAASRAVA
jgi:hypothetical protein